MKNLIYLLAIIFSTSMEAKTKPKDLVCPFDNKKMKIDLGVKLNINDNFAYKVEFFKNNKTTAFGYCMLRIDSELKAEGRATAFNQVVFTKDSCTFFSKELEKELNLMDTGSISYNERSSGKVVFIPGPEALTCHFE